MRHYRVNKIMLLYVIEHCHERSIFTPVWQIWYYFWCRVLNDCTAHFYICFSINLSCSNLRMSQKITNENGENSKIDVNLDGEELQLALSAEN